MRQLLIYIFLTVFYFSSSANNTLLSRDTTELEKVFILLKLTNIHTLDSSIQVDLRYASENNFMKMNMYGQLDQAYLQLDVVKKLVKAQQLLKNRQPHYSLIIFDATRPLSIQQLMWDKIKVPAHMRSKYLSDPKYGSLHNYGAAVDVSIVDENGKLLDMATPFDSFEKMAYPFYQERYYKAGKLTEEQYRNRRLLQSVMKKAGFMTITTEWWHFNSCYRKQADKWYPKVYSHLLSAYKKKENYSNVEPIKEDLIFRVQIYTSGRAKSLSWSKLNAKADFRYFHRGLYKYTSGQFQTLNEANKYKNQMRKFGFKGSFVVPFYKGKRISIKDANVLMQ